MARNLQSYHTRRAPYNRAICMRINGESGLEERHSVDDHSFFFSAETDRPTEKTRPGSYLTRPSVESASFLIKITELVGKTPGWEPVLHQQILPTCQPFNSSSLSVKHDSGLSRRGMVQALEAGYPSERTLFWKSKTILNAGLMFSLADITRHALNATYQVCS